MTNRVINFLKEHNYNYMFCEKFFEGREKNAIVDLLVAKNCNNIFIGNDCSSFSYYIEKVLDKNVKKVFINLDKIFDDVRLE